MKCLPAWPNDPVITSKITLPNKIISTNWPGSPAAGSFFLPVSPATATPYLRPRSVGNVA